MQTMRPMGKKLQDDPFVPPCFIETIVYWERENFLALKQRWNRRVALRGDTPLPNPLLLRLRSGQAPGEREF